MNYKMMGKFISQILFVEAAFMLPALLISTLERNIPAMWGFALSIVITAAAALVLYLFCRHAVRRFYAREGLVCRYELDLLKSDGMSAVLLIGRDSKLSGCVV